VHQVGFSLHDYVELYGQQNIKYEYKSYFRSIFLITSTNID